MDYIQLLDSEDSKVATIYKAYCETFPEEERRNELQFKDLFHKKEVKIISIFDKSDCIGYLIIWDLIDFTFIEHFEIFEKFRNRKLGAQIIKDVAKKYSKLVLETEPEDSNEFATRRIDFYKRNGFQIISDSYTQPSYGKDKPPLDLLLFANWKPENVFSIVNQIHKVVYEKL